MTTNRSGVTKVARAARLELRKTVLVDGVASVDLNVFVDDQSQQRRSNEEDNGVHNNKGATTQASTMRRREALCLMAIVVY